MFKSLAIQGKSKNIMLFSQRKKFTPVKDTIQKESMDKDLRSGLWSILYIIIWKKNDHNSYYATFQTSLLHSLFIRYWHSLFKIPVDNLPYDFEDSLERIREHFFKCEWFEVYDFIEFTALNCPDEFTEDYISHTNKILEREKSGYRFVDKKLTDLTSDEEIESIESAIKDTSQYSGVSEHLKTALGFLSDRKSPNYRNSVKESISSVESLSKVISNDPKATLGSALNTIEKTHKLHPAFKKALSNLYGYTSNDGGIRHALLEEDNITYTDAKFMLVSCSAFVNYILGKISEKS